MERKEFSPGVYENIDLESLVAYAVWSIEEQGEICTPKRLIAECFTLFPKKFALLGYPHWPDSARVNRARLRARNDKRYLQGGPAKGFSLTPPGRQAVERVARMLVGLSPEAGEPKALKYKSREEQIIGWVIGHPTFRRYVSEGKAFTLGDNEFRHVLHATSSVPNKILARNMEAYLEAAEIIGNTTVLEFLRCCIAQKKHMLC